MAEKSWTVSDKFWEKAEPLIPKVKRDKNKAYQRRKGGNRKPMDPRKFFEAIVYLLRTGIQWKALLREYGSSSSIHRHFQKWSAEEFFQKLWKKVLCNMMMWPDATESLCRYSCYGKRKRKKKEG